jgi:SH3-like domain-containing protein
MQNFKHIATRETSPRPPLQTARTDARNALVLHAPFWLAAFAILAGGIFTAKGAFAQEAAEVVACRIAVYPTDPDPKGTNLRAGPGTKHKTVTVIKDSDSRMEITGAVGNWLRVRKVTEGYGGVLFSGEAWVFGPLTSVRARTQSFMYQSAAKTSDTVGRIGKEEEGTLQSCSGGWAKIEYKKIKGWLEPNAHCGNAMTTCV